MGYMINFIVYTIAMVGIISLAVFVYKKFSFCAGSKSKFLNKEIVNSTRPRLDAKCPPLFEMHLISSYLTSLASSFNSLLFNLEISCILLIFFSILHQLYNKDILI